MTDKLLVPHGLSIVATSDIDLVYRIAALEHSEVTRQLSTDFNDYWILKRKANKKGDDTQSEDEDPFGIPIPPWAGLFDKLGQEGRDKHKGKGTIYGISDDGDFSSRLGTSDLWFLRFVHDIESYLTYGAEAGPDGGYYGGVDPKYKYHGGKATFFFDPSSHIAEHAVAHLAYEAVKHLWNAFIEYCEKLPASKPAGGVPNLDAGATDTPKPDAGPGDDIEGTGGDTGKIPPAPTYQEQWRFYLDVAWWSIKREFSEGSVGEGALPIDPIPTKEANEGEIPLGAKSIMFAAMNVETRHDFAGIKPGATLGVIKEPFFGGGVRFLWGWVDPVELITAINNANQMGTSENNELPK